VRLYRRKNDSSLVFLSAYTFLYPPRWCDYSITIFLCTVVCASYSLLTSSVFLGRIFLHDPSHRDSLKSPFWPFHTQIFYFRTASILRVRFLPSQKSACFPPIPAIDGWSFASLIDDIETSLSLSSFLISLLSQGFHPYRQGSPSSCAFLAFFFRKNRSVCKYRHTMTPFLFSSKLWI